MVNVVLVSHSYQLACGVAELAEQMNRGCQIAIAAGMSEPENAIGTDAVRILTAIEQVYSPDGVVVLMDLGSALLSAETALELLDPEMTPNIKLCSAPLVEGTLAAVVAASSGAGLSEVITEAENALNAKRSQLGSEPVQQTKEEKLPSDSALSFDWIIKNPHGIHARPAAKIVEAISPFQVQVWLKCAQQFANARSYNQLIQLQVRAQQAIRFYAEGEDAEQALKALEQLATHHFGEAIRVIDTKKQQGISIFPDEIEGQAVCFRQNFAKNGANRTACISLAEAIELTQTQLEVLEANPKLDEDFRFLFQAHRLLLNEMQEEIEALSKSQNVFEACEQVFGTLMEQYRQLDDPYLQARAIDVEDLAHRLLANLQGIDITLPALQPTDLLCSDDLYPSTLVGLLNRPFLGICLVYGSEFSHAALIAKALQIPMVIQLGEGLKQITNGDHIKLNWLDGTVEAF